MFVLGETLNLGPVLVDHGDFEDATGWSPSQGIYDGALNFLQDGNVYCARDAREEWTPGDRVLVIYTIRSIGVGSVCARAGGVSAPLRSEPGTYVEIITVANGQQLGLAECNGDGSDAVCDDFHAWLIVE